jgi:hypothetical protein
MTDCLVEHCKYGTMERESNLNYKALLDGRDDGDGPVEFIGQCGSNARFRR